MHAYDTNTNSPTREHKDDLFLFLTALDDNDMHVCVSSELNGFSSDRLQSESRSWWRAKGASHDSLLRDADDSLSFRKRVVPKKENECEQTFSKSLLQPRRGRYFST